MSLSQRLHLLNFLTELPGFTSRNYTNSMRRYWQSTPPTAPCRRLNHTHTHSATGAIYAAQIYNRKVWSGRRLLYTTARCTPQLRTAVAPGMPAALRIIRALSGRSSRSISSTSEPVLGCSIRTSKIRIELATVDQRIGCITFLPAFHRGHAANRYAVRLFKTKGFPSRGAMQ